MLNNNFQIRCQRENMFDFGFRLNKSNLQYFMPKTQTQNNRTNKKTAFFKPISETKFTPKNCDFTFLNKKAIFEKKDTLYQYNV